MADSTRTGSGSPANDLAGVQVAGMQVGGRPACEHTTSQHTASEYATSERATSEHVTSEHVTSEHLANRRLACVDLPALPLQLLLRRQPDWRRCPTAVVEADSPLSQLLWVNEAARHAGILPGMRYAAGLALDRNLRAATVSGDEIAAAVQRLQRLLLHFSPEVEPSEREPGVFWLNASGLDRLYGSPAAWAQRLHTSLRRRRFRTSVVVGFTRFGSYSLARQRKGVTVLPSRQAESQACRAVPLARLDIDVRLRENLARLGVHSIDDFLALPARGIARRFGAEARDLYRLARGDDITPLQPYQPPEPDRSRQDLETAETDAWRLLFQIKRLLHPLLDRLARRRQAIAAVHLKLRLGDRRCHQETLQPATPTLDVVLVMELVRLRLEKLALDAGVESVSLQVDAAEAPSAVLSLFREHPRRDLQAALRAVARLRAEFGNESVVRAVLCPGHLPEAGFRWEPARALSYPEVPPLAPGGPHSLIRRLSMRPQPLGPRLLDSIRSRERARLPDRRRSPREHQCTRVQQAQPDADQIQGPYFLSDSWWTSEERRAYHFVETDTGDLLWVYYDQRRRRWYLQGRVE